MSVRAENVSFGYGERAVLRHLSLTVATGERIGILGVSGGGKSTLLKLLSGLYVPQEGFVEAHGERAPAAIRKQVAMVLQSAALFPASIRENITCGHPMAEETIARACEAAQLSAWIATLPEGLDAFVGERGGKVSGGQAQRIAIARAIAKDAPVILLDEATSALDHDTGSAVLAALSNLTLGKTVIHVSHQSGTFEGYDHVYRLEGGQLRDA